jgi:hypothetical protein
MTNKQLLIHNLIILLSISFVLIGCGSAVTPADDEKEPENSHYLDTPDKPQEIKSENRYPLIEIWEELDGSVSIRGKSLYFRMYDDETVEFDYQSRKENESGRPRYIYSIERVPLTKISDEEFRRFKSLLEDLTESKDIKKEYKTVAPTLDVSTKLTILMKENDTTERKIIINDADYDIKSSKHEKKFPNLLVNLIKEVHLIRVKLQETSEMKR